LETELLLKADIIERPFAAHRCGSRLGTDFKTISLEGNASRFPIEAVDFADALPHLGIPKALWHLSWDRSDLSLPSMQALRLLLNSRFKSFIARASGADAELRDLVSIDLARQVIAGAMSDADFRQNPSGYPVDSVGAAAWSLSQLCFPGNSAQQICDMMLHDPSRFESRIQSALTGEPRE